jgi:hypothetical protein
VFTLVRAILLLATVTYLALTMADAGPPQWGAPWIPEDEGSARFLAWVSLAAVVQWAVGWSFPWVLARRKSAARPADSEEGIASRAFVRFVARLAHFHGSAVWGVLASLHTHDARYALVFAIPSLLIILLLPAPKP